MEKTPIELLAPAKDLATGLAALHHGADAVYIGADRFGARAAAGNSMADIEALCRHAHGFHARVYLTLNTLFHDSELEAVSVLVREAWNAGVDALIVQDMAFLEMDLPPFPLHASTQMHNMDAEHIAFLEAAGFSRVVLARELDLGAISRIREKSSIALEAFVHGALCVSHSGRCWMSLAMGGRSANRGVCGQPCRLPWNLVDEGGRLRAQDKHLLSLKDMDRSGGLVSLLEAGVTSFKIEGRLKDGAYVKNVTAFYRKALDGALENWKKGRPASHGRCTFSFTPDPRKTFHRGATEYLLSGKRGDISHMDTPKSLGEPLCPIQGLEGAVLVLQREADLVPGDGLCFVDVKGRMRGLSVNHYEGKKIGPSPGSLSGLKSADVAGRMLYRNLDVRFRRLLDSEKSGVRRLPAALLFREEKGTFFLEMRDLSSGLHVTVGFEGEAEPARNPETGREVIRRQLEKLGDTPFIAEGVEVTAGSWFFRASDLNALRRRAVAALWELREASHERGFRRTPSPGFDSLPYPVRVLDASFNILNDLARAFYEKHGAEVLSMAHEKVGIRPGDRVMTTHHCLRYTFGACPRHHGGESRENWRLEAKGLAFTLVFDCAACRMQVFLPEKPQDVGL
jgi:putative protease